MVVETVSQAVAKSDAQYPIQTLREAIMRSSQLISVESESDPDKKGMGATCACVLIVGERLYTAFVGDTRIYLIHSGIIQQISIDHTWIQEAIDAGVIAPEEAKGHPNAHVIRRYLGSKQPVDPDTRLRLSASESNAQSEANQGLTLQPGDQVVLCSDGLTDLVSDEEITAELQNKEQETALQELVDLANQRGGHDNITVIALRLPTLVPSSLADTLLLTPQVTDATAATIPIQTTRVPQPSQMKRRPRKAMGWLLPVVALLLLVLVALAVGGLYWLYNGVVSPLATNTALPPASQQVTLPVQVTAAPGSTSGPSSSQTTAPSPSGQAGTPFIPTPVVTLTPWPTNTRTP
jgi:protein phosphatase